MDELAYKCEHGADGLLQELAVAGSLDEVALIQSKLLMALQGAEATWATATATCGAGYPFRLLDCFAERKHQGNQLLVLVDAAAALTDDQLLAICREIGFAESAFICAPHAVE